MLAWLTCEPQRFSYLCLPRITSKYCQAQPFYRSFGDQTHVFMLVLQTLDQLSPLPSVCQYSSFLIFVCLFACLLAMHAHMQWCTWKGRETFCESLLSFHHVGAGVAFRLSNTAASQALYVPNHLAGLHLCSCGILRY